MIVIYRCLRRCLRFQRVEKKAVYTDGVRGRVRSRGTLSLDWH